MWTQTLSFGPYGNRHALVLDQGVEPAIEIDGERHSFFDHRRVSIRWLCGTCLTGLMGALLIGSTIYAALDYEANFAADPLPAKPLVKDTGEAGLNPRKGDRLVKPVDIVAAKQSFHVATPTKIGDKEIMRMHNFARVETTLLTTTAGFADEVPRSTRSRCWPTPALRSKRRRNRSPMMRNSPGRRGTSSRST